VPSTGNVASGCGSVEVVAVLTGKNKTKQNNNCGGHPQEGNGESLPSQITLIFANIYDVSSRMGRQQSVVSVFLPAPDWRQLVSHVILILVGSDAVHKLFPSPPNARQVFKSGRKTHAYIQKKTSIGV